MRLRIELFTNQLTQMPKINAKITFEMYWNDTWFTIDSSNLRQFISRKKTTDILFCAIEIYERIHSMEINVQCLRIYLPSNVRNLRCFVLFESFVCVHCELILGLALGHLSVWEKIQNCLVKFCIKFSIFRMICLNLWRIWFKFFDSNWNCFYSHHPPYKKFFGENPKKCVLVCMRLVTIEKFTIICVSYFWNILIWLLYAKIYGINLILL